MHRPHQYCVRPRADALIDPLERLTVHADAPPVTAGLETIFGGFAPGFEATSCLFQLEMPAPSAPFARRASEDFASEPNDFEGDDDAPTRCLFAPWDE